MRTTSLWIILIVFSCCTHAQSYEIDHLRQQLREHPQQDTFRVNRLNDICNVFGWVRLSSDEVDQLASEALSISRKLGYTKGEGYALVGKARAKCGVGDTEAGTDLLQMSDSIARRIGDRELELRALLRLAGCYQANDYRLSLDLALKAERLAQTIGNRVLLSKTQTFIGLTYWGLSDYAR